ncbi:nucleotidyltransferase domain protein [bacterium BMS3Abin07]|nr:nucleotidyltransferase domain protein [bacterium BMS3Abin07]GBE31773.1 nucleotidyltransferase domain protein [bacterium BMS3Bbin05]
MDKTGILLSGIGKVLDSHGNIEFAYLFGSYADGNAFPASDIDIAVYLSSGPAGLNDELVLHTMLSRELKCNNVDLIMINNTRNIILLEDIIKNGKVIYDKNSPLREQFELKVFHSAIDFKFQRKVFAGR